MEAFCEGMRRRRISRRISRRSFLKHCPLTAPSLGLAPSFVPQIVHATETRPRTPVLWLHRLECPCGSESFMRPAHPLAKDVVRSMPSLGDDDTLMASAGHQAEAILDATIARDKGRDIRAVEGNPPLNQDGMSCIIGGRPFLDQLKHVAQDCKAIISWGSCASWGCVQAAKPDPTQAGHGCIGGSQDGFRDKGSSGDRLTDGAHVAIEVGALPALACAAPEDLADSAERLADVLQRIGASPAMVEGSCLGDAARPPAAARPECKICWRVYDPALGDPVWPVAPGTPFAALPAPWRCPQCDGDAEQFMVLTENT